MPGLVGQGGTYRWPAFVVDGANQPADPSSLSLTVVDPTAALVTPPFPVTLPTIIRDALGTYHYDWLVSPTAVLGIYTGTWAGILNGAAIGGTDTVTVVAAGSVLSSNAAYSYDPTTPLGKIRLLTDDRDLSHVDALLPLEQRSAIFTDAELQSILDDAHGDVYYAAARILVTISGNRSLLIQTRRIGRTEVQFGSVRADLQKQAQALIEFSNSQAADGIAEIDWTDFSLRRLIINEQLRTQSGG